jgi:hypothetical protein
MWEKVKEHTPPDIVDILPRGPQKMNPVYRELVRVGDPAEGVVAKRNRKEAAVERLLGQGVAGEVIWARHHVDW